MLSYCQQQSQEVNTGSAMFCRIYAVQQPARTAPTEQAPVSPGQFVLCLLFLEEGQSTLCILVKSSRDFLAGTRCAF